MPAKTNWPEAVQPLLKKYRNTKHPLEYKNLYQLMMMVVMSAQSTDHVVNLISPAFFEAYPSMESLSKAKVDDIIPHISKVRNFRNKANWMIGIAQQLKSNEAIPRTMEELVELPGIGRKSASVIQREAGIKPEGVIVDIHVVRVAPRIGITKSEDPKKIEQDIMAVIPQKDWEVGMSLSFLGREICRPTDPKHAECVMNPVCKYYETLKKKPVKKKVVKK